MPAGANLGTIASISYRDAGNEPGTFKIWGALLTAANFTAQRTLWGTIVTTAGVLTLGAQASETYGITTQSIWNQPTNGAAQELALAVSYKDATTGQRFDAKLPTLDPTLPSYVINTNAKDVINIDTPDEVLDFVTALNLFMKNPYNGNGCVVTGLRVSRGGK